MKITELVAALNKVQQIAGDIPVVLKDLGTETETVVHSLGLHFNPSDSSTGGNVTIEHGPADETSTPEPEPPAPPAA